jgi:PAT family beta-lactamase induction signal transducer AmpG
MTHKPTAPAIFAVTITPFGAAVGYVTIAVPFWLAHEGVSLAAIATMSGVAMTPHAIKFLWAPLLDLGAHRKIWFAVMTVLTAIFLVALAMVPSPAQHIGLFTLIATLAQIAATTSCAAADGLMACTTAESDKGKAGGWRMAGNVGGTGLLGALALWVATAANSVFIAGLTLAALSLLSCIALFFIDEPQLEDSGHHADRSPLRILQLRLVAIGHDLWTTVSSRQGWTGLVICAMPVGAGALTNLFSAMALDYHASEGVVEMVNGLGGGISGAIGSLLGGFLADKMNRRIAYALSGGLTALSGLAMMVAPLTPTTYAWGTILYCFANGIAFATLAAFILEMVGHSAAAATKYTLFIAIANLASSYVTILDGKASVLNKIGSRGSLLADAGLTFLGIVVLIVMVWIARKPVSPGGVSGVPATES